MQGFNLVAVQLLVGSVEEAECDVVCAFGQDPAVESGTVVESNGVSGIGGVDGLVWVEDGTEEAFLGSVGNGTQVRSIHGKAFGREVANGTQLLEDGPATFLIGGKCQGGAIGFEGLFTGFVGTSSENFPGFLADGWVRMLEKQLSSGGI